MEKMSFKNVNDIPEIEKSEIVNEDEIEMTLRVFPKVTPAPPTDLILRHLLEKRILRGDVFHGKKVVWIKCFAWLQCPIQ